MTQQTNTTSEVPSVNVVRPVNPEKPIVDEDTKQKNTRSKSIYPELNLSETEYVLEKVRRHYIGLMAPLFVGIIPIIVVIGVVVNSGVIANALNIKDQFIIILPSLFMLIVTTLVALAGYYVYISNKLYLTNESVIQEIQKGLFNHSEQTISLDNIEDISFSQTNLAQNLFNYGTIEICTEGEGTNFTFTYVSKPKEYAAALNNAVEAFQNGRPV